MTVIKDLSQASTDQIKALQKKELEILKYFKYICEENNLPFVLAGGSCIGAVRHHGFIPWDDDVDVFMMRPDYERLYREWNTLSNNSQYELCRSDEDHNYRHAAMTLNDNETTFINFRTMDQDVNQGIAIDILPMDLLSPNTLTALRQRVEAVRFQLYINQRLPDHQGKLLRTLTRIPLALVKSPKKRYQIWKKAEARMIKPSFTESKVAIELVSGLKALSRPLRPEWFTEAKTVSFEDTEMPIPAGYDEYLSTVFGDYMKIPSKADQQAKHHTSLIDTENGYKKYRGQYYLLQNSR